jgi:hypothetical protein
MVMTIIGSTIVALGISLIISSFFILNKRGLYMFIAGFVIGIIGIAIYPKNPLIPIELKNKNNSIYLKGYKDGIKDCKNK